MKKKPCILFSLICATAGSLCFSFSTLAKNNLHAQIHEQALDYIEQRFNDELRIPDNGELEIDVNEIDPRINIPACNSPFHFSTEPDALDKAFFSLRIACSEVNWFTYASVRVSFTKSMVVTSGTISPDTVLTASNVRVEQVDVNKARHTGFTSVDDVIGARMKYRVRGGQPIQRRMLCYVCEGDRITIAARVGGMEVKTSGIAQQDGTIGETIEVKNARSNKSVFAQVKNTQEVVVNL
ncbi:flagellar basal body P-ring formation protein FlgA [Alteromonas sediminis]|uniref:Flagella basal body P-ring formation protein FlgA n=1 Tax=Alteromonas sediminis TaxID=2259342 RepID=A0A3N5XW07_9ALTE|nr:flagellar basal body P-ring formation chaperone FlgA [Alteromonas sediminis]RPJ64947.1 flagellar basal body P-ring formation protein FlgA [Alteromonas sediminis]